jgi:hypothetical protein
LLDSWKAFIESVNETESEGLAPYVNRIRSSFDTIFEVIATIRGSSPRFRFRSDIGCIGILDFEDGIVMLQDEISALLESPPGERFDGFLPRAFRRRIAAIMHGISDLFDRALLHTGMTVGTTVACRTALSSAVAGLAVALEMAGQIGGTFNAIRAQIFDVNLKLTALFEKLRFPFALALTLHEKAA